MDIYRHIWTYRDIFEHIRTYTTIFNRFQGPPEVVIPPELCEGWWPASGGSAPSEKTRPGFVEHVSSEFSLFLDEFNRGGLILVDFDVNLNN